MTKQLPNKITGANSRPASPFESHGLRPCAPVVESHGRYHGGAAVAQLDRSTTSQASRSTTARACVVVRPGVVPFDTRQQRTLPRAVASLAVGFWVVAQRVVIVVVEHLKECS